MVNPVPQKNFGSFETQHSVGAVGECRPNSRLPLFRMRSRMEQRWWDFHCHRRREDQQIREAFKSRLSTSCTRALAKRLIEGIHAGAEGDSQRNRVRVLRRHSVLRLFQRVSLSTALMRGVVTATESRSPWRARDRRQHMEQETPSLTQLLRQTSATKAKTKRHSQNCWRDYV